MIARSVPVVVLLLALTACGSEDDGTEAATPDTRPDPTNSTSAPAEEPSSEPTEESEAPADVVKTLLAAIYDNDADAACGLLTERYTKATLAEAVKQGMSASTCAEYVASASALYKGFGQNPSDGTYSETANDGKAATVRLVNGDTPTDYELINSGDGWLVDGDTDAG